MARKSYEQVGAIFDQVIGAQLLGLPPEEYESARAAARAHWLAELASAEWTEEEWESELERRIDGMQ